MSRQEFKSDAVRLAILIGLCSAIGVYLILTTSVISKDGVFYIEQARQVGHDPLGVCRRYPPGYPFLLWASHGVASLFANGDSPMLWAYSAQAVTLLCRVLALVPLYFLGRLLVGAANSFWALFILVILPYPAFYGSDVLREWPYVLFLSTGVLLLYWGLTTRRWWMLALVGLDAGLGCLIRPECAQLVIYAILGLIVVRDTSQALSSASSRAPRLGAGLLMIVGFAAPVVPYAYASGGVLPHQLRPSLSNMPPVISAVGPRTATNAPLEFEVRRGELLELPIQASDPDGNSVTFSLASVPADSRPAYLFRSTATGVQFWTLSDQERESLITVYAEAWDYEGIGWYAYVRPDARPGLQPVHRFWSAAQSRHFYTMSESEKEAILTESPAGLWTYEGAVFYAFGRETHPADASAVYRLWKEEQGYSWQMTPAGTDAQKDVVAWYAHPAGEPPAGAGIEGGVFRWRPGPEQQGEHQMNIVVTDGEFSSCQLMMIRVVGAGSGGRTRPSVGRQYAYAGAHVSLGGRMGPLNLSRVLLQSTTLRNLAKAADYLIDAIGEVLMVIPVLPWILGLYCLFRYRTERLDRVLIAAILMVNVGLMLGRHVWVVPGSQRRYCVAMIALTIFYLPAGVDLVARVLNRIHASRGRPAGFNAELRLSWFYFLMVGIVVLCAPKLISTPLRMEKAGLRAAGEWLRQNTPAETSVAVPDHRISFYAERQGLFYRQHPNSRKADYVVEIARGDRTQPPTDWREVYSVAVEPGDKRMVTVYRTPRAKD